MKLKSAQKLQAAVQEKQFNTDRTRTHLALKYSIESKNTENS
jgi:hypothetical protein